MVDFGRYWRTVYIKVDGEPVPKQSFRAVSKSGKLHGYTPKRVKNWSALVRAEAISVMADKVMLSGDLSITLLFTLSNHRRVDGDNLSKNILDSLNRVVYRDDSSIVELIIRKRVEKTKPGVDIIVEEINDNGDYYRETSSRE